MAYINPDRFVSVEQAKSQFFWNVNGKPVLDGLDAAERKWMARLGAYIRSDARRSMRKSRSGKASAPGRPPHAHTGELKRFMYFLYEKSRHSVIVGPVRLPRSRYAMPGLQEYGGTTIVDMARTQRLNARGTRSAATRVRRAASYPERPYMRPALKKNLSKIQEIKDSVK